MFRVLVDTCVWLDLAKDHRQGPLLEALELLVKAGDIQLILPRTILDEFSRNKGRIAEESSRSISSSLKRAKDIVGRLGEGRGKRIALAQLDDVDHRLPQLGEAAIGSIGRIEVLLSTAEAVEITDELLVRAAQRGLERRAPFHRQRNSIGDALIFEVYQNHASVRAAGIRYAFVTHNTKDFSHPNADTRLPHPDLAPVFSRIRSLYLISLGELLRRINPALISDLRFEQEWDFEPRRLAEILSALDELTEKVWYGRHGILRDGVETGRVEIVDKEVYPRDPNRRTVQRDIWRGARKAAASVERRYGLESLGPWDDFEWGMLSGKLSALRWSLGYEWDMLDT